MKKISVYVKGDRNSTAYYRIYQYFDKIDGVNFSYHIMYPHWVQNNYMPVSKQPKFLQVVIFIVAVIKVFCNLFKDSYIATPNVLVIHKRIISKYMPATYRFLLNRCHTKGCKIIWDYDDHLVAGHEMSQSTFNYFASLTDSIIVTHEYLKSLLPESAYSKVHIMPTTDGDMYEIYEQNDLDSERLTTFDKEIRMVWVATSANIKNLKPVLPIFDKTAKILKEKNKTLTLKIICDKPVNSSYEFINIENIRWTRQAAIQGMRDAHIGIMPLANTEFNKGKGGFKLVQYISIGLPSIGSDIGFNKNVLSNGCGFLVKNNDDWQDYILLLSEKDKWQNISHHAYQQWCDKFSFVKNLNTWMSLITNENE